MAKSETHFPEMAGWIDRQLQGIWDLVARFFLTMFQGLCPPSFVRKIRAKDKTLLDANLFCFIGVLLAALVIQDSFSLNRHDAVEWIRRAVSLNPVACLKIALPGWLAVKAVSALSARFGPRNSGSVVLYSTGTAFSAIGLGVLAIVVVALAALNRECPTGIVGPAARWSVLCVVVVSCAFPLWTGIIYGRTLDSKGNNGSALDHAVAYFVSFFGCLTIIVGLPSLGIQEENRLQLVLLESDKKPLQSFRVALTNWRRTAVVVTPTRRQHLLFAGKPQKVEIAGDDGQKTILLSPGETQILTITPTVPVSVDTAESKLYLGIIDPTRGDEGCLLKLAPGQ